MEFLWEWRQQREIADVGQRASRAENAARNEADKARVQIDSLTLACAAMWSILRDRLGVTDQQLMDRMRELDLSDGKLDGRISPAARGCPSCRRQVVPRKGLCLYCGTRIAPDEPFAPGLRT